MLATFLVVFMIVGVVAHVADAAGKKNEKTAVSADLGDLSSFKKISEDTMELVSKKQMAEAKAKIKELETAWDNAEEKMKPMNPEKWTSVDKSIDWVLSSLRSAQPVPEECASALKTLIVKFDSMSPKSDAGTK